MYMNFTSKRFAFEFSKPRGLIKAAASEKRRSRRSSSLFVYLLPERSGACAADNSFDGRQMVAVRRSSGGLNGRKSIGAPRNNNRKKVKENGRSLRTGQPDGRRNRAGRSRHRQMLPHGHATAAARVSDSVRIGTELEERDKEDRNIYSERRLARACIHFTCAFTYSCFESPEVFFFFWPKSFSEKLETLCTLESSLNIRVEFQPSRRRNFQLGSIDQIFV